MTTTAVRDVDFGMDKLIADLTGMGVPTVYVGVRSDGDGELARYAAVNEFGSADGHVPERSYLRSTADENRGRYAGMLADVVEGLIDGKDPTRGLHRLGTYAKADVQRKIRALKTPPNAPSTIAKKGSRNPLIDTGRLRQSIEYTIGEGE